MRLLIEPGKWVSYISSEDVGSLFWLFEYWKGKAPKPSAERGYKALIQLAKNYKTISLVVHYDVLKAMFPKDK